MFSAIASLFSAVVQAIVAVAKFFVDIVKEYPRATIAFVVAATLMVVTFKLTVNYTEKRVWAEANVKINKLQIALDKANKESEDRNLKIARLESDSTTFAEDMAKRLETTNAALKQTVSKYEARLAAEKAKAKEDGKVVYAQVPGEVGYQRI
jgi:cysteinyl-tRNA synthetase